MKCPYCAESIQDDARKCRFCGEMLTKADKLGYPRFYSFLINCGFDWTWLLMDYENHLFGEQGYSDCCLEYPQNPVGAAIDDRFSRGKEKIERLRDEVGERFNSLQDTDSQEYRFWRAVVPFLHMLRGMSLTQNAYDAARLVIYKDNLSNMFDAAADFPGLRGAIEAGMRSCDVELAKLTAGSTVGARFCGSCHQPAALTARFCTTCGQPLVR